jgi:hypothetical protein
MHSSLAAVQHYMVGYDAFRDMVVTNRCAGQLQWPLQYTLCPKHAKDLDTTKNRQLHLLRLPVFLTCFAGYLPVEAGLLLLNAV